MTWSYKVLRSFIRDIILKLFFARIDVLGTFRIPTSGPVIFVANHANQFVDPMMLISNIDRVVRFLTAAKSMRRPIIGHMARMAHAIGVERAQDIANKGVGKVSATKDSRTLQGEGTDFTKSLAPGAKVKAGDVEMTVVSVLSDTSCTVSPIEGSFSGASYKILPKVDQTAVYSQVHEALKAGDCIGIFPEGGSHDRTTLLDLKPGVAIMALGAMNAGAGPVKICPCGLAYFHPYKFRSSVCVEFGSPFEVPQELAELYKTDKRLAVKQLMELVEAAMCSVTINVPDYNDLQAIVTARALYKPENRRLTTEENKRLLKSFAVALEKVREEPRVVEMLEQISIYSDELRLAHCRDRDVRRQQVSKNRSCLWSLWALVLVVVLAIPAAVFFLVFVPIGLSAKILSRREQRTALAGSSVKVKALDVVASYKILVSLVLVPIYSIVLSILVAWLVASIYNKGFIDCLLVIPLCLFIVFPILMFVGVRVCDTFVKALKLCRVAAKRVCLCGRENSLLEKRTQLQANIRHLVEELGPQAFDDFQTRRVITSDSFGDGGLVPKSFESTSSPQLGAPLLGWRT